jgi:hypothetical protein
MVTALSSFFALFFKGGVTIGLSVVGGIVVLTTYRDTNSIL